MKLLRTISRMLVGIVFIFSGFVKAIDPLGSAYKFEDYFTAFGMEWLHFIALPLSFLLSGAEFMIGISLFFNIGLKIGTWAATIFMAFFTILTFFLAIFNPVTDCGCFGDALVITNWQTFFKNIFLIIPTLFLFIKRNLIEKAFTVKIEWTLFAFFVLLILNISLHSYRHLPLFDFRPYKIGTNIPEAMEIPDGAPEDEYKSILVYEKDGIQQEFTEDDYPWQDSTWKFVDAKHILIKKGYEPPIHDFTIETLEGEDITDIVLNDDSYTFLFLAHDLKKSKVKDAEKISILNSWAINNGYRFIGLTSSLSDEIFNFKAKNQFEFEFCNSDQTMLKTVIRSNPGLVLIKNGIIIGKWHINDIPEVSQLNENLIASQLNTNRMNFNKLKLYNILWLSVLISVLVVFLYKYFK